MAANAAEMAKLGLGVAGTEFRNAVSAAGDGGAANRRQAVRAPRNLVASRESARARDRPKVSYTEEEMVEDGDGNLIPYRCVSLSLSRSLSSSSSSLLASLN